MSRRYEIRRPHRREKLIDAGKDALVALLEAYFDETGTHDGSPIFAIAGYVYETEATRRLEVGWKGVLDHF